MDRIELQDLRFDCVVGILESEQRKLQPLIVDLVMELPLEETARTGSLGTSINYASVAEQIVFIGQHGRWRLLESFGTAVCRLVLADPHPAEHRARVEAVSFCVRKPEALGGLATPVVKLHRSQDWPARLQEESIESVRLEVLEETPMSAAYRLCIAPGGVGVLPPDMTLLTIAGSAATDHGSVVSGGMRMPREMRPVTLTAGTDGLVALIVGRPR